MKRITLIALMFLSGCATGSSFLMQPDGSYKITASRLTIFSDGMNDEAEGRAHQLCPMGYITETEFQNGLKEYTKIVRCHHPIVATPVTLN